MATTRTLILDGTDGADTFAAQVLAALRRRFVGDRVLVIRPGDLRIASCTGCFDCWIRTPGICVLDDDATQVAHALSLAERVVFLSPLVFGTYCAAIKGALERSIRVLLPTFRTLHGETHHPHRYEMSPHLVGIGLADRPDAEAEEIFHDHFLRNGLNFNARTLACCVIGRGQPEAQWEAELDRALAGAEEVVP